MRLAIGLNTTFADVLESVAADGRAAVTAGIRDATTDLKNTLRAQVKTNFASRSLPTSWQQLDFPKRGQSLRAAGRLFSRVPVIIDAYTETSQEVRSTFFVTALRSFQPGRPVLAKGRCLLGLRIRATDQLNGTIQDLSAISEALLPVWNGSAWAYQKTRTPAWAYLDVLRGSANRFPVADDRIQLADFLAWAARTEAIQPDGGPKQTFDGVIDTRSTVFQTLRDISAAGRAAPAMRDGKFSVVEDVPQTVPIQHFTPRNSWGFVGAKVFSETWHGVRVRFVDPDRDWQQAELVVYADGFDETNASRVDTLDLFGCTRRAQALREGRYHLAAATLRPELYELNCDVENLLCTRGDLVRVTHDVPLWGSGWGRVKALTMSGADVAAVVLDERIAVRDDRSYVVRWRAADAAGRVTNTGTGNPGLDTGVIGNAGGVDRHTLSAAQMPAHTHTVTAPQNFDELAGTLGSAVVARISTRRPVLVRRCKLRREGRPDGAISLRRDLGDGKRRPVHIPENVFVVGTMNIADRSLALVDLALRRRFAFVSLEPRLGEAWRQWVVGACKMDPDGAKDIESRLLKLNERIAADARLGKQFRIGHSYVTPARALEAGETKDWFRQVAQTEILPLLEEYWFDAPGEAQKAFEAMMQGW